MTLAPENGVHSSTIIEAARRADADLMVRILAGDREALAVAYQRHGAGVLAVANAVLRDQTAAEDVCQDVFVRLWRRPEKFDSTRGSLATYLAVVAHGRALDRLRSEQARTRREQQQGRFAPATSEDSADQAVASAMSTRIWAAVSALPFHEAEALRLAYFGDTTYREVARILDVAEGTVKSRIRSGLRRLRVAFIQEGIISAA
jgi:RNA polymerase sigma-70 factor (ECF subfamily)